MKGTPGGPSSNLFKKWSNQVTQGFVQCGLKNLQGQRLKNLLKQPVPVPDHNSEEV